MIRVLLLLLTASVLAFGAGAPKPAGSNDPAIEAAIRAKFAKSKINEEHFKVTVKSGVALIEGQTSVPQRKGVATRLAKTGGAREVVNKIEVSEAARKQMTDRLQNARDKRTPTPKPAAPPKPGAAVQAPPSTTAATAAAATPLRRMEVKR